MTPYSILPNMPDDQSYYNYLHSKTRMAVEGAFGILKQRFRIFKTELKCNTPEKMGELVA